MFSAVKLKGEVKRDFLQSQYAYYREFVTWAVAISVFSNITFWVSDCQLFGRLAWETLLPRTFMLLPLLGFLIATRKINTYRVMVPLAYLMLHGIMWCTIWAIYYLPIKTHASEGFIIMHLMFLSVGLCAPFAISTAFHAMVIGNIILSHQFNHYENFDLMLSLGIPCFLAIVAVNFIMGNVYLDHYGTKKQLEDALVRDQLTGVFNRNKIKSLTQHDSTQLVFDNPREVSILIVDIDHFKRVNDTYGHDAGDKVLVHTARQILDNIRVTDYAIRWGGEEFVVLMPACTLSNARQTAEKIRRAIETGDNGVCPVTVSIGVSRYDGKNCMESIARADRALYVAKQSGRNQVVCDM